MVEAACVAHLASAKETLMRSTSGHDQEPGERVGKAALATLTVNPPVR